LIAIWEKRGNSSFGRGLGVIRMYSLGIRRSWVAVPSENTTLTRKDSCLAI
jgi:hypothetical protein